MNRLLLLLLTLLTISCNGQKDQKENIPQSRNNIDSYEDEILSEDEMRVTTDKAIKLIQNKNYKEFRNLFAEDIVRNLPDQQINYLVDQLHFYLRVKEFLLETTISYRL